MPYDYIRDYYKVPAEYGRQIVFTGSKGERTGVIVEDMGNYIGVTFDDDKPTCVLPLHPTSGVEYLGIVKPRKMTKGQIRYREYLSADLCISFSEWLGIKRRPKNYLLTQ